MGDYNTWYMEPSRDAELVRRVYARSWPVSARQDYSADEIIDRLGERDLLWWQRKLAASPVRVAGGPARGGFGFVLLAQEAYGWDVTYAFCEPEAFGTGLVDELSLRALARLRAEDEACTTVGAWVLVGNALSQAASAKRGWRNLGIQAPPWPTTAQFYRYELALDNVDQWET